MGFCFCFLNLVMNMLFCFILFCFVFHTAVGIVNWKFAGMHVSVAYDAVSSFVVFPVCGLENISY